MPGPTHLYGRVEMEALPSAIDVLNIAWENRPCILDCRPRTQHAAAHLAYAHSLPIEPFEGRHGSGFGGALSEAVLAMRRACAPKDFCKTLIICLPATFATIVTWLVHVSGTRGTARYAPYDYATAAAPAAGAGAGRSSSGAPLPPEVDVSAAQHCMLESIAWAVSAEGQPFEYVQLIGSDVLATVLEEYPFLRNRAPHRMPRMTYFVTHNLLLGDSNAAGSDELFENLGITAVVNCATEIQNAFDGMRGARLRLPPPHARIAYLNLLMYDTNKQALVAKASEAADFIEHHLAAGERVLVHCARGRSRSVAIIMAYFILKRGASSMDEARAALARYRVAGKAPTPNRGFMEQLHSLLPAAP